MNADPLLLDVPERLETQRLILRVPRAGDGELILSSVIESLAELKLWMPWATDQYALADAEQWCRKSAGQFLLREQFQFLILSKADQQHLGNVGIFKFNWDIPSCEIGYWLRTTQTGRGYMSEAVAALTRMCLEQLKMNRIEIQCDDTNGRSGRVAELCGYTLDGVLHNHRRGTDGHLRDTRIYSKLPSA